MHCMDKGLSKYSDSANIYKKDSFRSKDSPFLSFFPSMLGACVARCSSSSRVHSPVLCTYYTCRLPIFILSSLSLFFYCSQTFDKSPRQNDEVDSMSKRIPDYFLG